VELRRKISFGLGYAALQRNEPVLEAANFTFLRGRAKIAFLMEVALIGPEGPAVSANVIWGPVVKSINRTDSHQSVAGMKSKTCSDVC
jgi:hypothetical protein